ncbi:MAG TPA: TraB/GumN family protein [Phaeodactylibacter sp.]|nr:TraB/GumN family protein [Phaeodactylibacter sp.]
MKNFIGIAFLLLSFLYSCSPSKKVVAPHPVAKTYAAKEKALLWKVTGKELKQPSYVFGTIHMISKEDFFLTDAIKDAFGKTNRVVFEINMEEMNDMSVLFKLMGKITMSNGQTLKDLISPEDYKLVEKHFSEMGLPLMFLEKIKPLFLSTFASGDAAPGDLQSGEMKSYEMVFMEMAQQDKKEMGGLETIEFQLSMFDSIPYKAQADMLVDAIKSSGEGDDQFKQMVDLYKKQDLPGLYKMIEGDTEGVGDFEDLLLKGRNKNWIPIIEKMIANKATFFAVGAGHLGGENGVVALLRKQGYEVTAVDAK